MILDKGSENDWQIVCRGAVQGRGVRPLVAVVARELGLCGCVYNDLGGVRILFTAGIGVKDKLATFQERLMQHLGPDLEMLVSPIENHADQALLRQSVQEKVFTIIPSRLSSVGFNIPVDMGICKTCENELINSSAFTKRRSHYLMNACAQCGPRYTVLNDRPFDRSSTSFEVFDTCEYCQSEYESNDDRRYHSQLISCLNCGPQYWLENSDQTCIGREPMAIVDYLAEFILKAGVVAIKGVGGFYLCCHAEQLEAIDRIRTIKHRPHKPLAVMATLDELKTLCELTDEEIMQLESSARPIVLVNYKKGKALKGIAPLQDKVGVMLPSAALHILLLERVGGPVIMTSANVSGSCMISQHERMRDIQSKIECVAFHDIDILNRVDDSVVAVSDIGVQTFRKGKGLSPCVVALPEMNSVVGGLQVIAMGAELKNSFAFYRDREIYLSTFMGDLINADVLERFQAQIDKEVELFHLKPSVIAIDSHPDYHSSKMGRNIAEQEKLPIELVQHHHAHAVACMVEHKLPANEIVFAIVMDGFGWGDDDSLWGGEILRASYSEYERIGCLKPFPILGGALSAKQPWRNALSLLNGIPASQRKALKNKLILPSSKSELVAAAEKLISNRHVKMRTSSVGRLFDGVAALLGFPEFEISYEGQAALWLERMAGRYHEELSPSERRACWNGVAESVLLSTNNDIRHVGVSRFLESLAASGSDDRVDMLAYQFHCWLAVSFTKALLSVAEGSPQKSIVLAGGVMQNQLLLRLLTQSLSGNGFNVYWPQSMPANDGAIALGQAAIAASRHQKMNNIR